MLICQQLFVGILTFISMLNFVLSLVGHGRGGGMMESNFIVIMNRYKFYEKEMERK